uniref:Secreted protein n=1 Tax=Davidia involucrata TaxID=16924 RepID=A0A5B7B8D1_DAVIN
MCVFTCFNNVLIHCSIYIAVSCTIDVSVSGEACDIFGGSTGSFNHNHTLLQRSSSSEHRLREIGSTRIARSRELFIPFPRQLLEMFLVDISIHVICKCLPTKSHQLL